MWFVGLGLLTAVAIVVAWRSGPSLAVGATLFLSLLFPKWLMLDFAGTQLDLRVASGIASLGIYCLHPQAVFRTRLLALDYLMIGMLIVHAISDIWHDGFHWGIPLRIYGEWMVPYLAGRVAIMNWQHVRSLAPFAVIVVMALSISAACESIWRWNVFESLFGIAETDGPPRNLTRWGLYRAFGPTKNQIYLGTLFLLLTPWSLFTAVLAYRRAGPKFWLAMPLATFVGIVCTGSRAPLLALIPLAYTMMCVYLQRWRKILVGIGVVATVLLALNASSVLNLLNKLGEKAAPRTPTIKIAEEEVV